MEFNSRKKYLLLFILVSLLSKTVQADDLTELDELMDTSETSMESAPSSATSSGKEINVAPESVDLFSNNKDDIDDLESLKEDVGDVVLEDLPNTKTNEAEEFLQKLEKNAETEKVGNLNIVNPKGQTKENKPGDKVSIVEDNNLVFDVGDEEKKLLDLAKFVNKKITPQEWSDLNINSKLEKYVVQKGDWLWKISKKLFGSGFYYSKIWALNPQISNPHEIEPGTILGFNTGDADNFPNVVVGEFLSDDIERARYGSTYTSKDDKHRPSWLSERKKLIDQGVYFQFASEETYQDLENLEKKQRTKEYEKYDPPISDIAIIEPSDAYDAAGFDKSSKIVFNFKEGFFLNTFVTTNVVQDLGYIKASAKEAVFINKFDKVYVSFDKNAKVKPGDMFSTYVTNGELKHKISDRSGFVYSTNAQIKAIRKIDDVWECEVLELSGVLQRKDRVTVYTPKIGKIARTFSRRNIESAIVGSYRDSISGLSFGDVAYIDRGRADGVEIGNVFDVYSFIDRGTLKKITPSPTYKIGELTVINLTDNFATVLITGSSNEINLGSIAISRTQEEQTRLNRLKNHDKSKENLQLEGKSLEELDVELNLDDVSEDILKKADQIQLTEDEIQELERQERDKSVIKDSMKDVKELDRLESEIMDAESSLNESKVDEDKFLEQQSLEELEKKSKSIGDNAFESLDEIEKDVGRKYLDEDLNNKENPYGLTEFDLEEVDELLNTDIVE